MFVLQVSKLFQAAFSATGLASILNGSQVINGSALVPGSVSVSALNTVSFSFVPTAANQTVNCAGATNVSGVMQITTAVALTLTFTNLSPGAVVQVRFVNSSGSPEVFKIAASNPASVAYSVLGDLSGVAVFDFTSTGRSVVNATEIVVTGIASGTSTALVLQGVVT